jgi:hypothetical protein
MVPDFSELDEWHRLCSRCAPKFRGDLMSEIRDRLIAALINPETSTVVDFEKSYRGVFVYGCDRQHAERCADIIIKEGRAEQALENMSHEGMRNGIRKLNIEQREREVEQRERGAAEERALAEPRALSDTNNFAMRGGQPGNWFTDEPAYEGGAEYEQAGGKVREEMERKVKSAFAK